MENEETPPAVLTQSVGYHDSDEERLRLASAQVCHVMYVIDSQVMTITDYKSALRTLIELSAEITYCAQTLLAKES